MYVNAGSGAGAADHCGWLVAPAWREAVAGVALGGDRPAVLLLRSADAGCEQPPLPAGARVVAQTALPAPAASPSSGDVGRSRAFVRQLRRFTRRLEREGVRFEWVAAGSVDERLLRVPVRAARPDAGTSRRRAPRSARAASAPPSARGAGRAASRAPRPSSRDAATRSSGCSTGSGGRTRSPPTSGDGKRAWDRHSMGSVLVYQGIRLAAAHGARTFDFLRGAEPYKYRFGAVDRWDRTWMVPRGPAGALLAARYAYRRS